MLKLFEKWWEKMCHARRFSYLFFVFLCIFPYHSSGLTASEWKEQLLILFVEVEMLCLNVYFCNSCRRTSLQLYVYSKSLNSNFKFHLVMCKCKTNIMLSRCMCVYALTSARYDFTTVSCSYFKTITTCIVNGDTKSVNREFSIRSKSWIVIWLIFTWVPL